MKNVKSLAEKISICLVLIVGLAAWLCHEEAQGSSLVEEESAEQNQATIYLPMLFNGNEISSGMVPYTGPPPENPNWLQYVNYFRSLAGLSGVEDNADWSAGDWLHSRYMVKNDFIGHSEDPDNTWFSIEGDLAARTSNLLASSNPTATDASAIAGWIQAPFHAVGILDPQLSQVGFGSFREQDGGFQMGAALDVLRGLRDLPESVAFPIIWPGEGTHVSLTAHSGEYPDPLSSCPGYKTPAGLPIIIQIGAGDLSPQVTAHSFRLRDDELAHCIFDETSYSNPDPSVQSLGRAILDSRDAIVLIPKEPLVPGSSYSVSITVNGDTYNWSFSTLEGISTIKSGGIDVDTDWVFSQP